MNIKSGLERIGSGQMDSFPTLIHSSASSLEVRIIFRFNSFFVHISVPPTCRGVQNTHI